MVGQVGRDADLGIARGDDRRPARCIGEHHRALAGAAELPQRLDRRRIGPEAVVHDAPEVDDEGVVRSEEHTSELQSLMRISYAVFCLKKKKNIEDIHHETNKKKEK